MQKKKHVFPILAAIFSTVLPIVIGGVWLVISNDDTDDVPVVITSLILSGVMLFHSIKTLRKLEESRW